MLDFHHVHMPNLDCMPNHLELNHALCKLGKGTGMDGIPANVLRMMPLGSKQPQRVPLWSPIPKYSRKQMQLTTCTFMVTHP